MFITNKFVWNDIYKSDFNSENYQAQGAVTPLLTGCPSSNPSGQFRQ